MILAFFFLILNDTCVLLFYYEKEERKCNYAFFLSFAVVVLNVIFTKNITFCKKSSYYTVCPSFYSCFFNYYFYKNYNTFCFSLVFKCYFYKYIYIFFCNYYTVLQCFFPTNTFIKIVVLFFENFF